MSAACQPGRERFHELASEYTVIPVWRELLADLTTPAAIFGRIATEEPAFLLESVEHERWSRFSFIGRKPRGRLIARGNDVEVVGEVPPEVPTDQGILAALEVLLEKYRSPALDELPPFHGGVVGYLGYDVVREVERLPNPPVDDRGFPDAVLDIVGELAVFDHWRQRVTLIDRVMVPEGASEAELDRLFAEAEARLDALAADGATPLDEPVLSPPDPNAELPDYVGNVGKERYCAAVDAAKEFVLSGDIFQVVLSQRFDLDLEADPFDLYRVLRQINPSPYMYFLRQPELTIVGSSPEPMVMLRDGEVISRPIAGTRRRGKTNEEDQRLAAELSEHPKEIAEHTMLVDLARNDVGRVVSYGSLKLDEMLTLERYSHVMHLTSQVSGALAPGQSPIDVIRATLPAGTVSGAPKVRAMEIIDEFEVAKRGPYAGVIGYIDFSGNIDTALAIRTMFIKNGRASIQAGAGIVADSVPSDEHLECENKARALLAAVPGARQMSAERARAAAAGEAKPPETSNAQTPNAQSPDRRTPNEGMTP